MRPLLLALCLLLTAGCGREAVEPPPASQEPAGPAPASAGTRLEQPALDAVAAPAEQLPLALIVKTRNNPFFDPMIRAVEETAAGLKMPAEVLAPAQETDKERQFAMVSEAAARGAKAILVAPADSRGIVPALRRASERGVMIINLDNRIDAGSAAESGLEIAGYVGADNEEGGRLAGEEMARALPAGSEVAVIEGIRGADNAEARKRGFEAAASGRCKIVASETADWDTQRAYDRCGAILAAHPALKGIFCANDKMAIGAIKAIQEAGRQKEILVIGYDNIPDVREHLRSGALHATIEQHPELMGRYGVRMAAGIAGGSIPRGSEFLVPLELIRGASAAGQ